ncbi:MAG: DUF2269 family protein [Solirubrobacteraceae bacterium]
MLLAPAVAFVDLVLAVHILAVVIAFGSIFAFPMLFTAARRLDPSVLPWLLRARQTVGRYLVNPGLLIVLVAGIYLATDEHQWKAFYVQWGLGAVVVIGAIEGALIVRRSGRLATIAEQDVASTSVPGGGRRTSATWSPKFASGFRVLTVAGVVVQLIVIVTIFLMATHAGA